MLAQSFASGISPLNISQQQWTSNAGLLYEKYHQPYFNDDWVNSSLPDNLVPMGQTASAFSRMSTGPIIPTSYIEEAQRVVAMHIINGLEYHVKEGWIFNITGATQTTQLTVLRETFELDDSIADSASLTAPLNVVSFKQYKSGASLSFKGKGMVIHSFMLASKQGRQLFTLYAETIMRAVKNAFTADIFANLTETISNNYELHLQLQMKKDPTTGHSRSIEAVYSLIQSVKRYWDCFRKVKNGINQYLAVSPLISQFKKTITNWLNTNSSFGEYYTIGNHYLCNHNVPFSSEFYSIKIYNEARGDLEKVGAFYAIKKSGFFKEDGTLRDYEDVLGSTTVQNLYSDSDKTFDPYLTDDTSGPIGPTGERAKRNIDFVGESKVLINSHSLSENDLLSYCSFTMLTNVSKSMGKTIEEVNRLFVFGQETTKKLAQIPFTKGWLFEFIRLNSGKMTVPANKNSIFYGNPDLIRIENLSPTNDGSLCEIPDISVFGPPPGMGSPWGLRMLVQKNYFSPEEVKDIKEYLTALKILASNIKSATRTSLLSPEMAPLCLTSPDITDTFWHNLFFNSSPLYLKLDHVSDFFTLANIGTSNTHVSSPVTLEEFSNCLKFKLTNNEAKSIAKMLEPFARSLTPIQANTAATVSTRFINALKPLKEKIGKVTNHNFKQRTHFISSEIDGFDVETTGLDNNDENEEFINDYGFSDVLNRRIHNLIQSNSETGYKAQSLVQLVKNLGIDLRNVSDSTDIDFSSLDLNDNDKLQLVELIDSVVTESDSISSFIDDLSFVSNDQIAKFDTVLYAGKNPRLTSTLLYLVLVLLMSSVVDYVTDFHKSRAEEYIELCTKVIRVFREMDRRFKDRFTSDLSVFEFCGEIAKFRNIGPDYSAEKLNELKQFFDTDIVFAYENTNSANVQFLSPASGSVPFSTVGSRFNAITGTIPTGNVLVYTIPISKAEITDFYISDFIARFLMEIHEKEQLDLKKITVTSFHTSATKNNRSIGRNEVFNHMISTFKNNVTDDQLNNIVLIGTALLETINMEEIMVNMNIDQMEKAKAVIKKSNRWVRVPLTLSLTNVESLVENVLRNSTNDGSVAISQFVSRDKLIRDPNTIKMVLEHKQVGLYNIENEQLDWDINNASGALHFLRNEFDGTYKLNDGISKLRRFALSTKNGSSLVDTRFHNISRLRSEMIIRANSLMWMMTEFTLRSYQGLLQNNIQPFGDLILMRPFQVYSVLNCLRIQDSAEAAQYFYGNPHFRTSNSGKIGEIYNQFMMSGGLVITNPQNILLSRAIQVTDYIGGGSTLFYNPEKYDNNENGINYLSQNLFEKMNKDSPSLLAALVPISDESHVNGPILSLSGRCSQFPQISRNDLEKDRHFLTMGRFANHWDIHGTIYHYAFSGEKNTLVERGVIDMMHRGTYRYPSTRWPPVICSDV